MSVSTSDPSPQCDSTRPQDMIAYARRGQVAAAHPAAVEHQAPNGVGMGRRPRHGHRSPHRRAHQVERFAQRRRDRSQLLELERQRRRAIRGRRQPGPGAVVAHQATALRQRLVERPLGRQLPAQLQMREPTHHVDQRPACTDRRVRTRRCHRPTPPDRAAAAPYDCRSRSPVQTLTTTRSPAGSLLRAAWRTEDIDCRRQPWRCLPDQGTANRLGKRPTRTTQPGDHAFPEESEPHDASFSAEPISQQCRASVNAVGGEIRTRDCGLATSTSLEWRREIAPRRRAAYAARFFSLASARATSNSCCLAGVRVPIRLISDASLTVVLQVQKIFPS